MHRIKQFLHRSPWISAGIIFGVTAIAIGVVYALGNVLTGWQVNSGTPGTVDLIASYADCRVVTAPSGKSVFVPTKTAAEWNSFKSGAYTAGIIVAACTYNWVPAAWGSCSVSCGGGTQTRAVPCKRVSDSVTVADAYCTGVKPVTSQPCNTGACPPVCYEACYITANYTNCTNAGVPISDKTNYPVTTGYLWSPVSWANGDTCNNAAWTPQTLACWATDCQSCGSVVSWTRGGKTCQGTVNYNYTDGAGGWIYDDYSGDGATGDGRTWCNNGVFTVDASATCY